MRLTHDPDIDAYVPNCQTSTWQVAGTCINQKNINILSMNIRGLTSKFSEFSAHLKLLNTKFSFIILTEVSLTEESDIGFDIDGYKCVSMLRVDRRGGGIKIYHNENIKLCTIEEISGIDGACEKLFLRANIPGLGKLVLGAVYRPPSLSLPEFLHFFETTLDSIAGSRAVIVGDFNIDVMNENGVGADLYQNIFTQSGFKNEINLPTYQSPITHTDRSCLDHIIHNINGCSTRSLILTPNISDHYATCLLVEKEVNIQQTKIQFRDYSGKNVNKFDANIQNEIINYIPPDDANMFAEYLTKFLYRIMNKYFPKKTKLISKKYLVMPWVSNSVLKCIRKKHRWFRLQREGYITKDSYKLYVTKLRRLLRVAEEEYFTKKFDSLGNDSKKNWNLLNKLIGKSKGGFPDSFTINNQTVTCPSKISNSFNKYFVDHPRNINSQIPDSSTNFTQLIPINPNSMVMYPITTNEVNEAIKMMRKEGQISDISRKFIKMLKFFITQQLSILFNLCIAQGIFPEAFKTSKITPVHKKGPKNQTTNYRPIAILCNFGKIFECILFKRLQSFFTNQGLLSEKQYGFRKNKSTELAILDLISKLLPAFQENKYAICCFLDYTACFDTIDRNRVLTKFDRYGVRGPSLEILKSYFQNRSQIVCYGEAQSSPLQQELGVVQGSRLGPLLFDIYTNDFNVLCGDDENIQYADDSCLVYVGEDLNELVYHVNQRMKIIREWCNENKLKINPIKSEFMMVTNKKVAVQPQIFLGDEPIPRVECARYLGVYIDNHLRFNKHIGYLQSKMSRICGISYRLSRHMNIKTAKNFYYSCAYGVITYCLASYGGVFNCTRKGERLEKLLNKIIKNQFGPYHPSSPCLYKTMGLLKLREIYKLKAALYMYRVLKMNDFPTLRNQLLLETPAHNHDTRAMASEPLVLPFPRIEIIRESYLYQFVHVWNTIPIEIQNSRNKKAFKKKLMELYINTY